MIRSKLFRKHFAIAAGTVLGFIALGALLTTTLIQRISDKPAYQPPLFFAHLVEELGDGDAVAGAKRIDSMHVGEGRPFDLVILDEHGRVLYDPRAEQRARGEPDVAGGPPIRPLPRVSLADLPREVHQGKLLGPDRGGGPRPPSVMRLDYQPARFLVMLPGFRGGPPPSTRMFPLAFISLVVTVLVGVALAVYLIFRSLREHVDEADRVITELQNGNLKARFPVRRNDEIGRAMERFNRMAEEIERLMEQLRNAERSRTFLLQELAHDLRTPVASLSNLLDTIFSQAKLAGTMDELAGLALKETDYIARLVEDLLLLAQVSEPSYRTKEGSVDLLSLLEEEGDALELRSGGRVRFEKDFRVREPLVAGDEHLLQRLFRNALENAFSFAKASVKVRVERDAAGNLQIAVEDDGPGFSAEMLVAFGERRTRRKIDPQRAGRLSLGLGSVIMKTVTTLHRGDLRARNRAGGGGVVEIQLPAGG